MEMPSTSLDAEVHRLIHSTPAATLNSPLHLLPAIFTRGKNHIRVAVRS
jgi:hypothetical protein